MLFDVSDHVALIAMSALSSCRSVSSVVVGSKITESTNSVKLKVTFNFGCSNVGG